MFWQKTIKRLKNEIKYERGMKDTYSNEWGEAVTARKQLSKELDQALEAITGYEGTIETLESENERQATINQALAEENRDLVRKLELYRAIFRQLNIDVKFPVNKTRG